ncbi:ferredoxin reductase family protein [Asanoa sp. WMMD1127]|uniref:ferredoxin reductase family protein n=1 Tax=Asanoa sp. WMMD1127 TaxID=3016107 RepID=UPI002417E49D|nr:ferredoxin reductase family protein [Asanoa sp. WMMD1127]MDG4823439.1 ferredoxin reductase family protein [Asanoa sp. WMMD1127]
MTATASPTDQAGRATTNQARAARLAVWVGLAFNVLIVEILFFTGDPAKNDLIGIAKFIALHAALLMMLQLLLVARLPWLDTWIGTDKLTAWHRWTGIALFWAVVLHASFVLTGYAQLADISVPAQIDVFLGVFPTLLGMLAVTLIVVVVALSVRFARRRLSYELWHAIHLLLYAAVTLAVLHQLYEGSTFRANALTTAYWWGLWGLVIVSLLHGRVVTPLLRNARHRLRVAAVVPESDTVTSIYVTGRDLAGLEARAGQFFIWRFLTRGRWWQSNPFSISSTPDGEVLRLTARAVGKTSAGLRHLPVGAKVFVEGPYGAFTSLHRTRDATLLIAGGVGITPIRSLLGELTGPVTVLYRVPTEADAVLRAELEHYVTTQGVTLHLLTGRTGAGQPPNLPFAPENLTALVPDIMDRDVYVCGPPAMTDSVLKSLRQIGVPKRQVHAERFALAGD